MKPKVHIYNDSLTMNKIGLFSNLNKTGISITRMIRDSLSRRMIRDSLSSVLSVTSPICQ
ncbi:hypothetical protein T01_8939 [Trichinella spiralis]|uniref:Uncharacterized protein n=1 Tax=Trichinella spiralis TaxID=6334 RepID=A0A0V1BLL9_TRISP|nr:hypothetical protein T01_8939 [Trichinella spiralis]